MRENSSQVQPGNWKRRYINPSDKPKFIVLGLLISAFLICLVIAAVVTLNRSRNEFSAPRNKSIIKDRMTVYPYHMHYSSKGLEVDCMVVNGSADKILNTSDKYRLTVREGTGNLITSGLFSLPDPVDPLKSDDLKLIFTAPNHGLNLKQAYLELEKI